MASPLSILGGSNARMKAGCALRAARSTLEGRAATDMVRGSGRVYGVGTIRETTAPLYWPLSNSTGGSPGFFAQSRSAISRLALDNVFESAKVTPKPIISSGVVQLTMPTEI